MKRKMYWGVTILIILLGTAAMFIIMHELAENRPLKVQVEEAEEPANQINQKKISENNPLPEVPISDSADAPVDSTESTAEKPITDTTQDNKESPEEINRKFFAQYGLNPPPKGYTYIELGDGSIELIKKNEPFIEVTTSFGFNRSFLSDHDWKTYQALFAITHRHIIETMKLDSSIVQRAKQRLKLLEDNAQGEIPSVAAHSIYNRVKTSADDDETHRLMNEALKKANNEYGIYNDRKRIYFDYEVIDQLIAEIKNEVNK